jgi:hypothetical protein
MSEKKRLLPTMQPMQLLGEASKPLIPNSQQAKMYLPSEEIGRAEAKTATVGVVGVDNLTEIKKRLQ